MSTFRTLLLTPYRQYRAAKANNRLLRWLGYLPYSAVIAYLLLLSFPQVLFAHEMSYKNMQVYSREPIDKEIYEVLDKVETRLASSPLNNSELGPRIFLTNSTRVYSLLSLNIGGNSFGKGYALLPTSNVFINQSDLQKDLVFRRAAENNQRSLSGVIAHETTHLLIRKRFGYWRNIFIPSWKKEGYAEYVGGGTTLSFEAGVRLWKANPGNDTGYQYFKYLMLVKYLLEQKHVTVDDLFNRDFDVKSLEAEVLRSL